MLPSSLQETAETLLERLSCAAGEIPPDLILKGATCLLPSGEWLKRDVAIKGQRIAMVAESIEADAPHVDLNGKWLVPGYIEPHAHIFGPLSIGSYLSAAMRHGTSCVVSDDSFTYAFLKPDEQSAMLDVAKNLPVLLVWSLRAEPTPRTVELYGGPVTGARDDVVQLGELLVRAQLTTNDPDVVRQVARARNAGLRIEGHCPGASPKTLALASTAGVTGDHEAMRTDEVVERFRAGMWAHLRYNGVLPDVERVVPGLVEGGHSLERLTLTTDWVLPPWIQKHGMIDAAIAAALGAGMSASDAYLSATLRPATYLGLDSHIGAVAPGRMASLNVLSSLDRPKPTMVFSSGQLAVENDELKIDVPDVAWSEIKPQGWGDGQAVPDVAMFENRETDPSIFLQAASMVRIGDGGHKESSVCLSIDPVSGRFSRARMYGLPPVAGMASTLTPSRLMVAVGRSAESAHKCAQAAAEAGGGIALDTGSEILLLPLPVGGAIATAPFEVVHDFWQGVDDHWRSLGHPFADPIASLLYIAADSLPGARFVADGLIDTKSGEWLVRSWALTSQ